MLKLSKIALSIYSVILLSSCASSQKQDIKKDILDENVSIDSVLDLARSSYLKGCTDATKRLGSKAKNKFNQCVMEAKRHEREIKNILE